jgi:hypothetical protein
VAVEKEAKVVAADKAAVVEEKKVEAAEKKVEAEAAAAV